MCEKRHPFLLLEVLIGIAILALFTATFFTSPFRLLREETAQLHTLEMCRIADDTFLEITTQLADIAWHSIGEFEKAPLRLLPEVPLSEGTCLRSYKLYTKSGIRTDEKSGRPYKKGIIKLSLELNGIKSTTYHHVVVYAKTAYPV